ncbi:Nonribosomal peptide synthetase dtxS1 [Cladobotryum mycophilum]|uniref:Nonribosomal peptide synthetase dtxS1 n=1 Tax=Cladobotryum mycophilum TaxID=491253 RepID=A0ABR0S842_9HYPO
MGSMKEDRAEIFWRTALSDCDAVPFPNFPASLKHPVADGLIHHDIPLLGSPTLDIICAAWALVVGRTTNSEDVVFGITVSRGDAVVAPILSTVPMRIQHAAAHMTVSEHLHQVQRQVLDVMTVEPIGLHEIARISPDCQRACKFQTLLDIGLHDDDELGQIPCHHHNGGPSKRESPYALVLRIRMGIRKIHATARFDSRAITPWMTQKMMDRLEFVMAQFDTELDSALSSMTLLTNHDVQEIWK